MAPPSKIQAPQRRFWNCFGRRIASRPREAPLHRVQVVAPHPEAILQHLRGPTGLKFWPIPSSFGIDLLSIAWLTAAWLLPGPMPCCALPRCIPASRCGRSHHCCMPRMQAAMDRPRQHRAQALATGGGIAPRSFKGRSLGRSHCSSWSPSGPARKRIFGCSNPGWNHGEVSAIMGTIPIMMWSCTDELQP